MHLGVIWGDYYLGRERRYFRNTLAGIFGGVCGLWHKRHVWAILEMTLSASQRVWSYMVGNRSYR